MSVQPLLVSATTTPDYDIQILDVFNTFEDFEYVSGATPTIETIEDELSLKVIVADGEKLQIEDDTGALFPEEPIIGTGSEQIIVVDLPPAASNVTLVINGFCPRRGSEAPCAFDALSVDTSVNISSPTLQYAADASEAAGRTVLTLPDYAIPYSGALTIRYRAEGEPLSAEKVFAATEVAGQTGSVDIIGPSEPLPAGDYLFKVDVVYEGGIEQTLIDYDPGRLITIPELVSESGSSEDVAESVTPADAFSAAKATIERTIVSDAARSLTSALQLEQRFFESSRNRFLGQQNSGGRRSSDQPLALRGFLHYEDGMMVGKARFANFDSATRPDGNVLVSVDADVQHDDQSDSTTATISSRVAVESQFSAQTAFTRSVQLSTSRSNISGAFFGEQDRLAMNIGGSAIHAILPELLVDGFISVGVGHNQLSISNDELVLSGDYETRSVITGAAVTGVLGYERYQIRPSLEARYGRTWLGRIPLKGRVAGVVDNTLALDAEEITLAILKVRPELRVALDDRNMKSSLHILRFSPHLSCERLQEVSREDDCGYGAEIGLSSFVSERRGQLDISASAEDFGDGERYSAGLAFTYDF